MPGTSTDPVTEPAVRVWPRFAHESVTASRLVRTSAFITHGTARQGITVRKTGPATHESVTDGNAVRVWPRFAHEGITANRLVRASALITHGTAMLVVTVRKIGPATREGIGEG